MPDPAKPKTLRDRFEDAMAVVAAVGAVEDELAVVDVSPYSTTVQYGTHADSALLDAAARALGTPVTEDHEGIRWLYWHTASGVRVVMPMPIPAAQAVEGATP